MSDTRVAAKPYIIGGASTSFVVPSTAVNNTALDGSVAGAAGGTTVIVSLTTTKSNDVIIVMSNQFSGGTITSVTSANVTWDGAAYIFFSGSNPNCRMTIWRGVAASPLTAESITIDHTPSSGTKDVIVFGVSGAQTASSAATFDSGGPTTTNGNISGSITTANANDFVVEMYQNENATQTVSAGYASIVNPAGLFVFGQYKIVTAIGTYSSGTLAGGDTIDGGITFAIKSL